ncbi:MAG: CPBP family intramembrane metalloprotease [Burkholderiales bacterium]|nr:CPBP family intramembrane metalloprotease [Phycisphaerae bacterium]
MSEFFSNSPAANPPTANPPVMKSPVSNPPRTARWIELVLLLVLPPLLWIASPYKPPLPVVLLMGGAYALWRLLADPTFDRRQLWNARALRSELPTILLLVIVAALLSAALLWMTMPQQMFILLRTRPWLLLLIVIGYPLVSVYPQELVYRAYFFHRFKPLFPKPWMLIVISAVLFAYGHIIFWSWIPVAATLIGGLLFGWRYHRSRSLAAVSIEHALYGQLIFTIGFGQYFYVGTAKMMNAVAGN